MRKKGWIISAVMCAVIAFTGCSDKDINYETDDSGVSGADALVSEEASADENRGFLAQQLGIPLSTGSFAIIVCVGVS